MSKLTGRQKDERDLAILDLIDQGWTQKAAAEAFGITRGVVSRMITEIAADVEAEGRAQ